MTPVPVTSRCAWRGDFASGHSLAVVNDGLVDALEARGVAVERLPAGAAPIPSDVVGVAAHWPPLWEAPTAGPFVVYQPWEFGEIPALWAERIRTRVDEVWTASEYSRQSYLAAGIAPELVHVVPNGIDLDRFRPDGPARPLGRSASTVFLFVGGTTYRKGIDLLLEAYGRAFTASDDVLLVIKSFGAHTYYRGRTAEAMIDAFRSRPGAPPLLVIDDHLDYASMSGLYRAADCLVQPYRGEGFCLPALEALACGLPVVATAGGPTDEFASDACAWRVPSSRIPLPPGALTGELVPAGEGHLLEPDLDALVDTLRAATDPAARAQKAAAARTHALRCSWDAAAEAAAARLGLIPPTASIRTVAPALVPDAKSLIVAVAPDWETPATWAPALAAYAAAFRPGDDTTLVLTAPDEAAAIRRVSAYLDEACVAPGDLADIVVADSATLAGAALELAADVFICADRAAAPVRARNVLPPDPVALRSLLVP